LYRHVAKRDNENVEKTERIEGDNLSAINSTVTKICNNINDTDKIQHESLEFVIEKGKRELNVMNDTMKKTLNDVINLTWLFINGHDENVGHKAIKFCHEYLEQAKNFLNKIREINTHINEYNCKFTNLTTYLDTIPEEAHEKVVTQTQNILLKFEYLHGLISDYNRMHATSERANNLTETYNEFRHLSDLKKSIEVRELLTRIMRNISENAKITNNFSRKHNVKEYFVTTFTTVLLNLSFWESELEKETEKLENLTRYVQHETVRVLSQESIQPAIEGIIFMIGFVGNGVMIIIFARKKDVRTASNMMLLNLAIGDMLNLIVNIPVFYSYTVSTKWQFGLHLCKAYRFLRQLGIGVSIYSIVVLSVQRFTALTLPYGVRCYGCRISKKLKPVLLISFVWLTSCMIAVPHTVDAGIYDDNCYAAAAQNDNYPQNITLIDLLLFCVIPLFTITVFSVLSAYHIKKSIRKLPGEALGLEAVKRARDVSSNILITLAIVSAISYIPFYLLLFLLAWTDFEMYPTTYYIVFVIIHSLLFGNSCFNPIALYIVSSKFRGYFNRYLLCRRDRKTSHTNNRTSPAHSLTLETKL
jgi:hypothetical protein